MYVVFVVVTMGCSFTVVLYVVFVVVDTLGCSLTVVYVVTFSVWLRCFIKL